MKSARHTAILEAIRDNAIGTQSELTEYLRRRGMVVTQATISRDIQDLRLIKAPIGGGQYRYALPPERGAGDGLHRARRMFGEFVVDMDHSENLIVIKTTPGSAQGVAASIDDLGWDEILGTVAGDDSILVIARVRRDPSPGVPPDVDAPSRASRTLLQKFMELRR